MNMIDDVREINIDRKNITSFNVFGGIEDAFSRNRIEVYINSPAQVAIVDENSVKLFFDEEISCKVRHDYESGETIIRCKKFGEM